LTRILTAVFRVDYGHAEVQQLFGADPRRYETLTKRFITDDANNLTGLETVRVEWTSKGGKWSMEEVPNSKEIIEADLCLLALGFLGPSKYLLEQFGVQTDVRGNVKTAHGVSDKVELRRLLTQAELRNFSARYLHCRRLPSWSE
jgi:NADPH-dependent glutamate synthase beta subunit-like oxidoreductase